VEWSHSLAARSKAVDPRWTAPLSEHLARQGAPFYAAIESMNGARFVHDRVELAGR